MLRKLQKNNSKLYVFVLTCNICPIVMFASKIWSFNPGRCNLRKSDNIKKKIATKNTCTHTISKCSTFTKE